MHLSKISLAIYLKVIEGDGETELGNILPLFVPWQGLPGALHAHLDLLSGKWRGCSCLVNSRAFPVVLAS